MKNILFFQYPWRMWRDRLNGIYRYANKAEWHIQIVEYGQMSGSPRKTLDFWRPDGCIVEGEYTEFKNFRQRDFDRVPTVFCDAGSSHMSRPYFGVFHDSAQTTLLGIRELIRLKLKDYAYVGFIQPREWSEKRREIMSRQLARKGMDLHVFEFGRVNNIGTLVERLDGWLKSLPKPCGLLAVNDVTADLVLQACRRMLIRVPEEIAVVGIDNDVQLCEHTIPTLTSVMPDFERSGYEAARLLDRVLHNPDLRPQVVRFGASQIVRRNSTTAFGRHDEAVLKAVEHIRTHFDSGLTAAEVCKLIGGSRRQAEYRFAKLVGRSIGAQILSERIARAQELLRKPGISIESIAGACGYLDSSSLRRAFRKVTGVSLREWQEQA